MGTVVVIGEEALVRGFGLVGAAILPASGPERVRAAWHGLTPDVSLVILTPAAAAALGRSDPAGPLVAVLP
jgi:vacuolar-type H+-ATPase subunit F/Vma7